MRMRVRVPVTTLWVAPDCPREVDAPAVADRPDVAAWLAALDATRPTTSPATDGSGCTGGSTARSSPASR